jgi:hypothetical protein
MLILKDARVQHFSEHSLLKYHLVFDKKSDTQGMIRYMRAAKALGLELIHITTSTDTVTTKELDANVNEYKDHVVLVGFIAGCADAKQITFDFPHLNSVWNTYKGEKAIVYDAKTQTFTFMDWGRAKGYRAMATTRTVTSAEVEQLLSQGKWTPENFLGPGVNFTMSVIDRSFKEQISVEALMLLTDCPTNVHPVSVCTEGVVNVC